MSDKTTVTINDAGSYYTDAQTREHVLHADLPTDDGGGNQAPTPEDMLMSALGSCMAQTAKLYANRKGWQIDRIEVQLSYERFSAGDYAAYEGDANFVHEITEAITIEGPLDDAQKARIKEIMGKCPVRRFISNPVFFKEETLETE